MKNFPSALIKQRNTRNGLSNNIGTTLLNATTQTLSKMFSGTSANNDKQSLFKNLDNEFSPGYERPELSSQLDEANFMSERTMIKDIEERRNYSSRFSNTSNALSRNNGVDFEDVFELSNSIFSVINNYKYVYPFTVPNVLGIPGQITSNNENDKKYGVEVVETIATPSLFNPYNSLKTSGVIENIRLMNSKVNADKINGEIESTDISNGNSDGDYGNTETPIQLSLVSTLNSADDLSDCSIQKLVELSANGELGLATYRYADFMFCKDLGKMPNNHLITLRKFPAPIGDYIFKRALGNGDDNPYKAYPDIGRLVTWFGTDDNKLENICKYNYKASWKPLDFKLDMRDSTEQDEKPLEKLANFFSPENNKLVAEGYSGRNSLLASVGQKLHIPLIKSGSNPYTDWTTLRNYDEHRVYEPIDTIRDTHIYEGKLSFNQDIELVFRYTLRSYDNINPKTAMLDLIGNIQEVTYRRGSFWSGENRVIGQGNQSVYKIGEAFVNKGFEKLGGLWSSFGNGNDNISIDDLIGKLGALFSSLGQQFGSLVSAAGKFMKVTTGSDGSSNSENTENKEKLGENVQNFKEAIENADTRYGWSKALRGMVLNQLGRPQIYAFNSMLSGDNTGPWHLTVGNPRNPIMSIGNLILEESSIEHSGPLGIDDFPTEIKLTVKLKHAMSRDSIGIQKMYTRGEGAIYYPMNLVNIDKYLSSWEGLSKDSNKSFLDVKNNQDNQANYNDNDNRQNSETPKPPLNSLKFALANA